MFVFSSFRLDFANASLHRATQAILLTPKALNVLSYLVEHAGQWATKDDLWRAVWPGVTVTDATLTMCVSEIRKALRDERNAPRYIETVHGRGYRFVAPVFTEPIGIGRSGLRRHDSKSARTISSSGQLFVGRQADLVELHKWLELALEGERQIVFVTGEPGIGKTTLVDEFLRQQQASREERLWIGRGQCIEHYGTGEPYLPLLDEVGRLRRKPGGGRLLELLDKYAPSWLVQMPSLLSTSQLRKLQGKGRRRHSNADAPRVGRSIRSDHC